MANTVEFHLRPWPGLVPRPGPLSMASFRLRAMDELARVLAKMGPGYERAAIKALRKTAQWGKAAVLETSEATKPRPRAWGTYERGWKAMRSRDGAHLVNTTFHASFVEEGRAPGRAPPTSVIMRWVLKKRIETDPEAARAVAFLIARKIGRVGTEGRFVLARTMPKITDQQERLMERAFKQLHAKRATRW